MSTTDCFASLSRSNVTPITTLLFLANFLPSPLARFSTTMAAATTALTFESLEMIFARLASRLEKSPSMTLLGAVLSLSETTVSASTRSFHFEDVMPSLNSPPRKGEMSSGGTASASIVNASAAGSTRRMGHGQSWRTEQSTSSVRC